ncbi:MAG TPA: hypothetical protein VFA10_29255, partial [Ktedonobacteraceae bacterium]|nr:hypothetical protein [Ktedonobacteraceae bacterium]
MNTLGESQKESGAADETMVPHQISRRDLFTKSLVAGAGVIGLGLLDELPAYAATLDPEHPLAPANTLQVVGLATDGTIWHTIRFANGSWQSNFGNVNNQEGNGGSLRFTDVGCAGIGGDLHVTAVNRNGIIWHTIRFANGSWQSTFGNVNNQEGNGGSLRFTHVDCANVGGNLHVAAVNRNHIIWHTIRFANGSWQSTFGNVNNQEGNGGSLRFTDVGTAG